MGREVAGKRFTQLCAVLGAPIAAMDHDGDTSRHGRRAPVVSVVWFRYEEFAPLTGVFAVAVLVPQHCALLCIEPIASGRRFG